MTLKGYNVVINYGYYRGIELNFKSHEMPLIGLTIRTIVDHISDQDREDVKFNIIPVYEEAEDESEEAEDESDNQVD